MSVLVELRAVRIAYYKKQSGVGHPCIKGKFPAGGGGWENNRTFAFWGRILVPAAVFLAFLESFCTFF